MQPSLRNKSLILNRIAVILKNLKNNKNYVEKIERERERETERDRGKETEKKSSPSSKSYWTNCSDL